MTGPTPPLRVHVSDTAVARVAAHRARAVPGVLALQADLTRTVLGIAGTWLGPDARRRAARRGARSGTRPCRWR